MCIVSLLCRMSLSNFPQTENYSSMKGQGRDGRELTPSKMLTQNFTEFSTHQKQKPNQFLTYRQFVAKKEGYVDMLIVPWLKWIPNFTHFKDKGTSKDIKMVWHLHGKAGKLWKSLIFDVGWANLNMLRKLKQALLSEDLQFQVVSHAYQSL